MERILSFGRILVTGSSGQVGSALLQRLGQTMPELEIVAPSRTEMDLGIAESVRSYVQRVQPQWIISSGAYTAVDAAESDREAAWAANAIAPGVMAEAAARSGAVMIHLSTDYVFPGTGTRAWVETDSTGPLNVYGASKLAGEQAIAASGAAHVILRTSWVYSATGKNFVRTMLRLLTSRQDALRVVGDQHGGPTSAKDLATAICSILKQLQQRDVNSRNSVSGVYHCAGSGETTWAGLASAVRAHLLNTQGTTYPDVVPVPSSEYPTPAARPLNSRLNCSKLREAFQVELPEWQMSLREVLDELTATDAAGPGQSGHGPQ